MHKFIAVMIIAPLTACSTTSGALPPEALLTPIPRVAKGTITKESDFQDYVLKRFEREDRLDADRSAAYSIAYPKKAR